MNIVKHKWIFLGIAGILLLVSILSLIFRGFNLDTDFAGGMAVTYQIKGEFTSSDVESIVNEALGEGVSASSVQQSGEEVVIKFGFDNSLETDEERSDYSLEKINAITAALQERYGAPVTDAQPASDTTETTAEDATATEVPADAQTATAEATADTSAAATTTPTEAAATAEATDTTAAEASASPTDAASTSTEATTDPSSETATEGTLISGAMLKSQDIVSPSTGQDLARSAFWMSLLACAAILIYITFRFEFTSGVVAIIALIHDVVLLLGVYSLFQWSVDTNFIAAILTVLGYSINNTIVIMDRIRENTRHSRKETYAEIANTSILQTLNRSINTTVTTLLTIGMVYILGVSSIQEFALPIIIGIVFGFYSSVFVSGPLWALWRDSSVNAKKKSSAK